MVSACDPQVERLETVRMVTGGYVAAHDQRKFMSAQVVLKMVQVNIGRGKRSQFRRRDLLLHPRRAQPCNYLDRVELPEEIRLGDERIGAPINRTVGQSRCKRHGRDIK